MRLISVTSRGDKLSCRIDYGFHSASVVDLPVNDYLVVIGHADKATIEHPVCGSRKSKPVPDRVWSAMFDRANMGGFGLQSPSPVHQAPTSHRTAPIVCMKHGATERTVTEGAVEKRLRQGTLNLERGLLFSNAIKWLRITYARERLIVR